MRLYLHNTMRGVPAWGVWTKPYKASRLDDMVGTVLRYKGFYWPFLGTGSDREMLDPCVTRRGARRLMEVTMAKRLDSKG